MSAPIAPYQVIDLPPARRLVLDFMDLTAGGNYMYALLEVDVTRARALIAAHKARTNEQISFTAFLAFCLARAVDEDKLVQAYLKNRKQLVIFDDVHIGVMIEREVDGVRVPLGYVVQRANYKTVREIHTEIRSVQSTPPHAIENRPSWLRLMQRVPGPLMRLLLPLLRMAKRHDPARHWAARAGTVGITAVGMFGKGGGWGIANVEHTLCLIVGGIARKPALVGEQVEPRDLLHLTIAFDHAVIDGAPAARFAQRLVALIECADGLEEATAVGAGCP